MPIVGLFCAVYVTTVILDVAVGVATSVLPASIAILLSGAVVVYLRLREIKEGAGVADLFSTPELTVAIAAGLSGTWP